MTWLLIMLGLCIWWMSGYKNRRKLKQIAKEMPTNIPAIPFVGQAWIFLGNDEDLMKAFQTLSRDAIQQGGTIAYWHGGVLKVAIADPVVADIILKTCLSKDERLVKFLRVFTGDGLLAAPVHIWRPRRKAVTPVFSSKNLNGFMKIFTKQSAKMVELLRPRIGAAEFSVWKYVTTYTFDAVCESNMGVKVNSQERMNHPFLEAFDKVVAIIAARMCRPWIHPDFIYRILPSYRICKSYVKYIEHFISEITQEKRRNINQNGYKKQKNTFADEMETSYRTLLEIIMETPGKQTLTDQELTEEMKVILSAATDTSACAMCFTLVLLSRYPDVQEKVYKELYEIFGNSDRVINVNDLPKLKYLELVIKESLRLYPPVPAIVREVNDDVKLPSGTTLVKGVGIVMYIWGVHRNPRYWGDDAEEFRPERFLEPLQHPAQFIPFSYGLRNCIGYQYAMMSLKTVLSTFLRSYKVLPPLNLDPSRYHEPLKVKFNIMMKDVDDFVVRLEKRT